MLATSASALNASMAKPSGGLSARPPSQCGMPSISVHRNARGRLPLATTWRGSIVVAGGVDRPDRDSSHDLKRDSATLLREFVHQFEQRVQGAAFVGSERPAALQNHTDFNQLVR